MDFLLVPTVRYKLLHVYFATDHARRNLLRFDVTANPTARWDTQRLCEARLGDTPVRYRVHENDAIFADSPRCVISRPGIESTPTPSGVDGRQGPG